MYLLKSKVPFGAFVSSWGPAAKPLIEVVDDDEADCWTSD